MQIDRPRYKILALAPFHPDPDRIWDGAPLAVDRFSLDDAMAGMQIRLFLPLDAALHPDGGLDITLDSLKSLHPDGLVQSNAYLSHLLEARNYILTARGQGAKAAQIRQGLHQWPDLPPLAVKADLPATRAQSAESRVDSILDMVALPEGPSQPAPRSPTETDQIDGILQRIMAQLFGHAPFQTTESAWRGLKLLLQQGGGETSVRASLAPIHGETLEPTLEALTPYLINDPPHVIVLDLPFDNSALSMERLHAAGRWAAALMVPLITWAPVEFFQIRSWRELSTLPFLPNHLETQSYAKFAKLRTSEEGQWLSLTCNRFLIRFPYGRENRPRQLAFDEDGPLWIAPVWALGALIAQSADQGAWPTRFNDIRRFRLQDLALNTLEAPPPKVSEAVFDRDRLDQFVRAGITPLASEIGRDRAFFPKAVTCAGSALAYQLLLSQATQFILWCKDHLPAETGPDELQLQLTQALEQFSQHSRPPGFERVMVTAAPANDQGRIPVHLVLTPDPDVLPSRQAIELRMDW